MALPLKPSTAYLQLELNTSRHYVKCGLNVLQNVLRNIAQFRLRAHTLRAETRCWQIHNRHCVRCGLNDVQDEKHVYFHVLP